MNLSTFSMDFGDSLTSFNDDLSLSAIIAEMVSRPPHVIEYKGKKLRFDEVTSKQNESFDAGVDVETENGQMENKVAEESLDEFDLIVMRKGVKRKSDVAKKNSILTTSSPSAANKPINFSTPVLPKSYTSPISLVKQKTAIDLSFEFRANTNPTDLVVSTSFFALNPNDEVDLFERSTNFRNMQDINSDDESDETNSNVEFGEDEVGKALETTLNGDDFNQHDTFDRLVGLD